MRRVSAEKPEATRRSLWLPALITSTVIAASLAMLCRPRLAAQAPAPQPHFVFPDTPAAQQLQAWLAAFTSGDRATVQAFVQKVMTPGTPSNFVDQTMAMRSQMGGLDFQRVEESSQDRIVAIAQTRTSRERLRISVEVESAEPHRIARILLEPVSPPANTSPPPEMTPAQAAFARTQPSTHQFFAWLAAFNSGDRAQYLRFLQNNFPSRVSGLDQDMEFRANTGGFEFKKLEQASPTRAGGLVQERDSDQFGRFTLEVEPALPQH